MLIVAMLGDEISGYRIVCDKVPCEAATKPAPTIRQCIEDSVGWDTAMVKSAPWFAGLKPNDLCPRCKPNNNGG